ncbi:MAG: hypothetical protein PVS3B1_37620 [Ktedonobacteraceae bacterium]
MGKWDERIPIHVSRPVMKHQWLRKKNLLQAQVRLLLLRRV